MLKSDLQLDPVVEILRLAYRRGLGIQREQTANSKATNPGSLQGDLLTLEQEHANTEIEAKEVQAKAGK